MPASAPLDPSRRYVRIRGERGQGFIEFDFAIGEPEVFVEMILDKAAFAEFCLAQRVEYLPPETAEQVVDAAADDWHWRLADATHTRFR